MADHQCFAYGCRLRVPFDKFMCRQHWYMVPTVIRHRIWAHYKVGQGGANPPSKQWRVAAAQAILAVAQKEGHRLTTPGMYIDLPFAEAEDLGPYEEQP